MERTSKDISEISQKVKSRDLHITLDEVERRDGRVSEAAAEDASEGAGGVVLRRVHLDLLRRLLGRRDQEAATFRGRRRGGGGGGEGPGAGAEHLLQVERLGGGGGGGGVEEAGDQRLPRARAVRERHGCGGIARSARMRACSERDRERLREMKVLRFQQSLAERPACKRDRAAKRENRKGRRFYWANPRVMSTRP